MSNEAFTSMGSRIIRSSLVQAVLLGALIAGRADAQAQQGTITGRVTDAITGQPIAPVQLSVIGTNLGTQANSQGQYTLRGVPAGTIEVRALRVGFAEQRRTVIVAAGQTVALDFQIRAVAVTLSPVVTTATGSRIARGRQLDCTDRRCEHRADQPHIEHG